ncbi:hypothetical protein BLL40_00235 [Domibacillus mangrovi]|uniref:Probable transposase IS891/IS1136/IS1341 domain-containing protein n=1 Tax=Domibacillus mangrovi TaxID=1714354 RepID=A0A1Q5P6M8_9BACI|nr:hypothetical protein BLL40_00235 [Domibacillus mangrovi]
MAKEQRILSRRKEIAIRQTCKLSASKNDQEQRIKVARLHERIANARIDYLHKVSTEIINMRS